MWTHLLNNRNVYILMDLTLLLEEYCDNITALKIWYHNGWPHDKHAWSIEITVRGWPCTFLCKVYTPPVAGIVCIHCNINILPHCSLTSEPQILSWSILVVAMYWLIVFIQELAQDGACLYSATWLSIWQNLGSKLEIIGLSNYLKLQCIHMTPSLNQSTVP